MLIEKSQSIIETNYHGHLIIHRLLTQTKKPKIKTSNSNLNPIFGPVIKKTENLFYIELAKNRKETGRESPEHEWFEMHKSNEEKTVNSTQEEYSVVRIFWHSDSDSRSFLWRLPLFAFSLCR